MRFLLSAARTAGELSHRCWAITLSDAVHSIKSVGFLGKLRHRQALQPSQFFELPTSFWVSSPGVYDVSGWSLRVADERAGLSWDVRGTERLVYVESGMQN